MTHSHLDHVGAIEPLKEVYPELKVIVHETEAPFLIGGDEYSCYDYLPGGLSTGFKLLMRLGFMPPFYQYKVSISDCEVCLRLCRTPVLSCMAFACAPASGRAAVRATFT